MELSDFPHDFSFFARLNRILTLEATPSGRADSGAWREVGVNSIGKQIRPVAAPRTSVCFIELENERLIWKVRF